MTTAETTRSAYPASVEALLDRARDLRNDLGEMPSRNRVMTEFKIGAPKAKAVLEALEADVPTTPAPTRLHVVHDPEPATEAQADVEPEPGLNPVSDLGLNPVSVDGPTGSEPAPNPVSPVEETALEPTRTDVADLGLTPVSNPVEVPEVAVGPSQVSIPVDLGTDLGRKKSKKGHQFVLFLLALPAAVAIWSGWVGLGGLAGFGVVHPLPGIWDSLSLNTAITLPIGVEAYAAFALRVWLSGSTPKRARRFAKTSAISALVLGAAGQVAYHLMTAAGMHQAPWWITTFVAVLPVGVLGAGAALGHLLTEHDDD
jgi:hypothetical protein